MLPIGTDCAVSKGVQGVYDWNIKLGAKHWGDGCWAQKCCVRCTQNMKKMEWLAESERTALGTGRAFNMK